MRFDNNPTPTLSTQLIFKQIQVWVPDNDWWSDIRLDGMKRREIKGYYNKEELKLLIKKQNPANIISKKPMKDLGTFYYFHATYPSTLDSRAQLICELLLPLSINRFEIPKHIC